MRSLNKYIFPSSYHLGFGLFGIWVGLKPSPFQKLLSLTAIGLTICSLIPKTCFKLYHPRPQFCHCQIGIMLEFIYLLWTFAWQLTFHWELPSCLMVQGSANPRTCLSLGDRGGHRTQAWLLELLVWVLYTWLSRAIQSLPWRRERQGEGRESKRERVKRENFFSFWPLRINM